MMETEEFKATVILEKGNLVCEIEMISGVQQPANAGTLTPGLVEVPPLEKQGTVSTLSGSSF